MICPDITPSVYGFFSSEVPALLYYSHIPSFVVALLLGIFLFYKNKRSLAVILLLVMNLLFCTLVILNLLLWTSNDVGIVAFIWPLSQLVYLAIPIVAACLFYAFANRKNIPALYQILLSLTLVGAAVLVFSHVNFQYFDVSSCEVVTSSTVTVYQNIVFGLVFAWILITGVARLLRKNLPAKEKGQISMFLFGLLMFLSMLVFTWQVAAEYGYFELEQYGLFGMVLFMGILAFMIVKFKTFNVGLIASQALVVALVILIASQFAYVRNPTNLVLTSISLVLTAMIGIVLIRSVKREISQREHIELLAKDLEKANAQQVILIHFITHQIKGFVAKSRNIFAMIKEGEYGPVPPQMLPMVEEGFRSDTKGAETIAEILSAANIKSGKVAYTMNPMNLKEVIETIVLELKPHADKKGLALTSSLEESTFNGDKAQLVNAFRNLIDNSIKYTPSGSVDVSLHKKEGTLRFEIKDTGVGIDADDMKNLFTEGGHGKNSQKINVESTGFGLYIVKNIIEAHKGKVWAESEGEGKGSRFIVELPA